MIIFIPKKSSRHYDLGAYLTVRANYEVPITKTYSVNLNQN